MQQRHIDRRGRIVGEVILPDGRNLNRELVKAGGPFLAAPVLLWGRTDMTAIGSLDTRTPERRSATRYPSERNMSYTMLGNHLLTVCAAKTINMSNCSVLFSTEDVPRVGKRLVLRIHYPEFDLVTLGRVVRATGKTVAVCFEQCHFQTLNSQPFSAADLWKIIREAKRRKHRTSLPDRPL